MASENHSTLSRRAVYKSRTPNSMWINLTYLRWLSKNLEVLQLAPLSCLKSRGRNLGVSRKFFPLQDPSGKRFDRFSMPFLWEAPFNSDSIRGFDIDFSAAFGNHVERDSGGI